MAQPEQNHIPFGHLIKKSVWTVSPQKWNKDRIGLELDSPTVWTEPKFLNSNLKIPYSLFQTFFLNSDACNVFDDL